MGDTATDDGCSSIWKKTLKHPNGDSRNETQSKPGMGIPALDLLEIRLKAGCKIEKCDMIWCLVNKNGECVCYGDSIRQLLVNLIFTDC